ncbi:MAG: site-specific integrase [Planctomycetaceae bacterium]
MAKNKPADSLHTKVPKVRIVRPSGRPFQLRYTCPSAGREIRISTGGRDEQEAKRLQRELEARLLLGMETQPQAKRVLGPEMDWSDFREEYRVLHLTTVRDGTATHAESRLDLAERILRPKSLGDIANPNALQQLQARLLAGACSARKCPRSPHTVKGYMTSIIAALNWAYLQGWLTDKPRVQKIKTAKQKVMKGRPITSKEFEELLNATGKVVGKDVAESWKHVLRGLWESALRIEELMHVSWDIPGTIHPIWKTKQLPILEIPAAMQKNDTDECIPLLPGFEKVLLETPREQQTGWVFNPGSLQRKIGRSVSHQRPKADWIGKVIARIGNEAGIVVEQANERTGRPVKYASAHDLRRSCGERLRDAGVPPLVICRVMRHSSWETTRKHYAPGNIQRDAEVLRESLQPKTAESEPSKAAS